MNLHQTDVVASHTLILPRAHKLTQSLRATGEIILRLSRKRTTAGSMSPMTYAILVLIPTSFFSQIIFLLIIFFVFSVAPQILFQFFLRTTHILCTYHIFYFFTIQERVWSPKHFPAGDAPALPIPIRSHRVIHLSCASAFWSRATSLKLPISITAHRAGRRERKREETHVSCVRILSDHGGSSRNVRTAQHAHATHSALKAVTDEVLSLC